ncbi:hypothetical protein ILYODFUR_024317 [Ilyodon furcidens]|uniref:Uncharacterized protein n=1 Tax=Ilyodon furcidens TaxID=33524 RepID=A0ABV0U817_9TELE
MIVLPFSFQVRLGTSDEGQKRQQDIGWHMVRLCFSRAPGVGGWTVEGRLMAGAAGTCFQHSLDHATENRSLEIQESVV